VYLIFVARCTYYSTVHSRSTDSSIEGSAPYNYSQSNAKVWTHWKNLWRDRKNVSMYATTLKPTEFDPPSDRRESQNRADSIPMELYALATEVSGKGETLPLLGRENRKWTLAQGPDRVWLLLLSAYGQKDVRYLPGSETYFCPITSSYSFWCR
jgi:hypothetical protein